MVAVGGGGGSVGGGTGGLVSTGGFDLLLILVCALRVSAGSALVGERER